MRHSFEYRSVASLFLQLELLPVLFHLFGIGNLHIAKNMRVAIDQFFTDGVANIGNIKVVGLGAYLSIEHDVKKQVAQLLFDLLGIVVQNCIG